MSRVSARCRLSDRKQNNDGGRARSEGEITTMCFRTDAPDLHVIPFALWANVGTRGGVGKPGGNRRYRAVSCIAYAASAIDLIELEC